MRLHTWADVETVDILAEAEAAILADTLGDLEARHWCSHAR